MRFDRARQFADAVLLEGYVTFGVLAPRSWSEAGGCEPWWMEAQCLVERREGNGSAYVEGKLRFLQVCRRRVEESVDGGETFRDVESVEVDGRRVVSWDEGDVREIDLRFPLPATRKPVTMLSFEAPGGSAAEAVRDGAGRTVARVIRERRRVRGTVTIVVEPLAAAAPLARLRVRVENDTAWDDPRARRDDVLRASCAGSHLVLSVAGGAFVSLLDPPEWAAAAAASCLNTRTFPVLAGEPGSRDLLLAAPIILYDHPQLAPESRGDPVRSDRPADAVDAQRQALPRDVRGVNASGASA